MNLIINFDKLYRILFSIGLFLFAFNQMELLPFLGEYVREFGAIFFFLGFTLLCIEICLTGKISFPYQNKLLQLIFLFYIIVIICTIINLDTVINNYFKRITGISRFIRQYVSISIPLFVFAPLFWRVFSKYTIEKSFYFIRKIFYYSLLFCSFYAFWEILYSYFHIYFAKYILDLFSFFPLLKVMNHSGRISSFTYEPPALAIYLITISGWMLSYIYTEKTWIKKSIPTLLILILTFFSGSRTALLVITALIFLFITYLFITGYYRKEIMVISSSFFLISCLTLTVNSGKIVELINEKIESLNFKANLKSNVSNQTRFGMIQAMKETIKDNPIFGVGYGQHVYHSRFHYPRWAKTNNWEFEILYENKKDPSFPPSYNLYLRLLAETGIVGLISWLAVIIYSLTLAYKFTKNNNPIISITAISILFSLIGLYINWFQIDTFRMYGFWLCIVILIKMSEEYKSINLKNE